MATSRKSPESLRTSTGNVWVVALLRKLAFEEIGAPPGRGCYWDAHELGHESTDTVLAFPEWEWADFVDGCPALSAQIQ